MSARHAAEGDEMGAVAVEFALVLPLLLAVIAAVIDFGFAFNAKLAVTQAAREGARVVALGGSEAAAAARVADALSVNGQVLSSATSVQSGCDSGLVAVQVTGTTSTLLPVPDITVVGRAVMSCG